MTYHSKISVDWDAMREVNEHPNDKCHQDAEVEAHLVGLHLGETGC
jgi:hypothetical protein